MPLIVTGSNSLTVSGGAGSVAVNVSRRRLTSGTYPVLQYSGAIQGTGFPAFTLGTYPAGRMRGVQRPGERPRRNRLEHRCDSGDLDRQRLDGMERHRTRSPRLKTGLSTAVPRISTQRHCAIRQQHRLGRHVDISNGNVLPTAVVVNNDASHPYTLTGINSIAGTRRLSRTVPAS